MSLQSAVRTVLVQDAPVIAIVGQRVFPEARTQGAALPCIVYGINNEVPLSLLASPSSSWKADVEIVSMATTKSVADSLAAAVMKALDGFVGTVSSTEVQHCVHSRSVTAYSSPQTGEAQGSYLHTSVFSIMHKG